MIKKASFIFISIAIVLSAQAQNISLKFNNDGKFKIVQFTDIHYKQGKKESEVAITLIKEVLDAERPDLVIFTGDVIWARPVEKGLDEVFAPVIERGIPWAYIFGNHDDEFGKSRQEMMDYAIKKPYCLSTHGERTITGVGNFILEVKDKKNNDIKALLYLMDSGSYAPLKNTGRHSWFALDQVVWYKAQSAAYTKENKGKPYPALAFFHIPLAEYALLAADPKKEIMGTKGENVSNGRLNSGMFTAMRESGDVMGTFVGHDHDNDYIGSYYGIYLAYGRYSGGKTVYNNLGKNGCRIIELKEGKRQFSTYIRLLEGEKLYEVEYPKTLPVKD